MYQLLSVVLFFLQCQESRRLRPLVLFATIPLEEYSVCIGPFLDFILRFHPVLFQDPLRTPSPARAALSVLLAPLCACLRCLRISPVSMCPMSPSSAVLRILRRGSVSTCFVAPGTALQPVMMLSLSVLPVMQVSIPASQFNQSGFRRVMQCSPVPVQILTVMPGSPLAMQSLRPALQCSLP